MSVLATPKFEAQLQQLTEVGTSNFSEISTRLAEAADFYEPEGGSFAEVLQTFVEAFDEALLLGPEGLAHHDRKQTALVQHVSAQVSGVSDQLDAMRDAAKTLETDLRRGAFYGVYRTEEFIDFFSSS